MIIIITIIIIIKLSQQCTAGVELEHSVNPKTPTPHNQPVDERKGKNSGSQKERAD